MTKCFSLMLLCVSLALVACGEEKATDAAKPVTQPTTQASVATAQSSSDQAQAPADATKDSAAAKAVEAPADKVEPSEATTKVELAKPASLEVGKKRYETTCKICHDQGMLDAPKLDDKANWAKRAEQDMEVLYTHSAQGFNKMPAQATGDISEAEVYAAVDYMLTQIK